MLRSSKLEMFALFYPVLHKEKKKQSKTTTTKQFVAYEHFKWLLSFSDFGILSVWAWPGFKSNSDHWMQIFVFCVPNLTH